MVSPTTGMDIPHDSWAGGGTAEAPSAQRMKHPANPIVQSRLGPYAGLFFALRAKHPPTADHALRVAVTCSKWARWRSMEEEAQRLLEVAALLHDIGKIGIPDRILMKQSQLDRNEALVMEMQVEVAEELLRGAQASPRLVSIVKQAHNPGLMDPSYCLLEARMLAIADAWDSMTTEQVFRRAHSRERALEELFSHADQQFDASLVEQFAEMIRVPHPELDAEVASRWIGQLVPELPAGFGDETPALQCGAVRNLIDSVFHYRLLETIPLAAVYLDASGQILYWNSSAEKMTGRRAVSTIHQLWSSETMGLESPDGSPLAEGDCPVEAVICSHTRLCRKYRLHHPDGDRLIINLWVHPVFHGRELAGLILLASDESEEAQLKDAVRSLNEAVTTDPLTKVANRAELDRRLPDFVQQHLDGGTRGSVMICDIDFFKKINDTHGHQAGDQALITFAEILRESARAEDLVARYGGEEFVILCENCDNPAATARAEQIRRKVEETPVPALKGATLTSSFGVTEIQPGDDAETVLARADRALFTAKESGRNRVVQLGAGHDSEGPRSGMDDHICDFTDEASAPRSLVAKLIGKGGSPLLSAEYLTAVPVQVVVEKLKGFIEDHRGQLLKIEDAHAVLRIDSRKNAGLFRRGERPATLLLDVTLLEVQFRADGNSTTYQRRTKVAVTVRPHRARDRRQESLRGQALRLLASFQAYLVAQPVTEDLRGRIIEPR